ncbi:MAG: hypothetical protein P8Y78_06425 [Acidihalobacter sp.]
MNPELRRHLWLELNPQRLVLMPLVLVVLFVLAYRLGGDAWQPVGSLAATAFVLLTVLWGGRRVHFDVLQEVEGQTWDSQRMSALGAWRLTWGKLLGAPVYSWYGGLLCLGVYAVVTFGRLPAAWALRNLALLVLAALFVHGLALFGALLSVRNRASEGVRRSSALALFGLLILALLMTVASPLDVPRTIEWYGYGLSQQRFALLSLIAWSGWLVYGAYRLIRIEQGYENGPLGWVLFMLFCALWLTGLLPPVPEIEAVDVSAWLPRLGGAFVVCTALTYVALFTGDKRLVTLSQTWSLLRGGQWRRGLHVMPRWLPAYGVTLPAALWLTSELSRLPWAGGLAWMPVTAMVFMLRDVFLVLWLHADPRRRHAASTALALLVLGYLLIPALLSLAGWTAVLPAFLPRHDGGLVGLALAVAETTAVAWALAARGELRSGA